ncbi:MAG TPA: LLM class F420-dependent oxidoreductase [Alphaproteobacteria bacterium]|jgi:probable F420-dependent oxidoreductase|nr:LLM class F420-dependent oxidoreductase [Alphaproteobacteria bacterium]
MKIGILPLFTKGFIDNQAWCKAFLRKIDTIGVESVWTVEHPIVAEDYEKLYSYSEDGQAPFTADTVMPDPLEWLGLAAGVTENVKLGTGVLLMPLHSPIILAKRVATLDSVSGGRVLLGVGIGWQKEEFAAAHVPYNERGRRFDEGIDACRILWRDEVATYNGQYYQFNRVRSDPKPANPNLVPLIIGGSTEVAARRAGRTGDGFFPHAISPDNFAKLIEVMNASAKEHGRDPSKIELSVSPTAYKFGASLDLGIVRAYADLGVSRIIVGAFEAGGTEPADMERFVKRVQDEVVARL